MKKMLFALLAVTTLSLSSCSKDNTINRQLDGSWDVTTVDDNAVPSGSTLSYTFNKDKKGKGTGTSAGTGLYSFANGISFNYTIADEKITITVANSSASEVYTISDHSKKEMTFVDANNKKTILKAK